VYRTHIPDLGLSTTPLTNGCRKDDTIQLGPFSSQSLFQFVQISDVYFLHLLLQYFSHAVINWFHSGEFIDHRRGGTNFGVFFCYNSMVARVRRAFQVSQGRSIETLFR